jgi:hypothetical protein
MGLFEWAQIVFCFVAIGVAVGGWIWTFATLKNRVDQIGSALGGVSEKLDCLQQDVVVKEDLRALETELERDRDRSEKRHAEMWNQINRNRASIAAFTGSNGT